MTEMENRAAKAQAARVRKGRARWLRRGLPRELVHGDGATPTGTPHTGETRARPEIQHPALRRCWGPVLIMHPRCWRCPQGTCWVRGAQGAVLLCNSL